MLNLLLIACLLPSDARPQPELTRVDPATSPRFPGGPARLGSVFGPRPDNGSPASPGRMGADLAGRATAGAGEQAADALVPSPSVLDFTRGGGWGGALGLGVERESAYDGSDEVEVEVDPAGALHWRRGKHMVFLEGNELGWRGLVQDRLLLQAGLRREGGREADDSSDGRLDGLEDTGDELVGMVEARYALDEDWRAWVGGRVMSGDSGFGNLGVLAAGYRFGSQRDGTGTEAFLFSTFGDADFLNRDFGITPAESASSGLAATDLGGGYRSTGLTLVHRRNLGENLQLILQGGLELYDGRVQDSPLAREDFETELGVTLVWWF